MDKQTVVHLYNVLLHCNKEWITDKCKIPDNYQRATCWIRKTVTKGYILYDLFIWYSWKANYGDREQTSGRQGIWSRGECDYKEIALFLCLIVVVIREEPYIHLNSWNGIPQDNKFYYVLTFLKKYIIKEFKYYNLWII